MAAIRKLAGDTVWYGVSSILTRMISYFLVPLYTSVFELGEYGIVTDLYALIAFFLVVFTYGMETTYFRFSTKDNNEEKTFNTSLSSILVSSFLFSSMLILFSTQIVGFLNYPGQEKTIYYAAGIIAIDALVSIPYARLRLKKKAKKFAFIRLTQSTLTILLNLFFFLICYPIAQGKFWHDLQPIIQKWFDTNFIVHYVLVANLLANSLILILLFDEIKGFRFTLKLKELKPMLLYSTPLLFMGLAGVTNEMLSRLLLKHWLPTNYYKDLTSQEALGVFGACYKLSVFMQLGIQAFRYAAEPFFFSNAGERNSPELFSKVMTGFVQFNTIIFLVISVNLDWIGNLILRDEAYRTGLYIVPFLLLGYLFSGVYYNLSVWYKITDRTHFGAIITTIGAILTVMLNYFLIPKMGYFGSSIVTLVTFFSMAGISYIIGQKYWPVPYQLRKIFEVTLIACSLVYLCQIINWGSFLVSFFARNLLVILFIMYVYWRERKSLSGQKVFGITLP